MKGQPLPMAAPAGRQMVGKYHVSPPGERTVDGIQFMSKWEAAVYIALRDTVGRENFQLQPRFELLPKLVDSFGAKHPAFTYVADFLVFGARNDSTAPVPPDAIVLDAKGQETRLFKLKRRMFVEKYQHPLVCLPLRNKKKFNDFIVECVARMQR